MGVAGRVLTMDLITSTTTERKAGRSETAVAFGLAVLLVAIGLGVTPGADLPGPIIPGFMPAFAGAMVVIDLVLAVLLFSKGSIARRGAPIRLGTAYLFAALIIVPHIAAFPGAIVPDGLIGTSATAVWLWSFWHTGFAIAIGRHVIGRQTKATPHAIRNAVLFTLAIVVGLTLLTTVGLPYLPAAVNGQSYRFGTFATVMQFIVVPTNIAAVALVLFKRRLRTAEDLWLTVAMLAACLDVWLTYRAGARFSIGWYAGRLASLTTSTVVLVSLFIDITQLYSQVAKANRLLEDLAHVDGLTELGNRRHFDSSLATEWRRAQRDERSLSILMIDVDEFKKFNDTYGHQEGDACLQAVARCIDDRARRPGDLAARYGGEEFALILPSTDAPGAAFLGEALRQAIRDLGIPHAAGSQQVVTVSIGIASVVPRKADGSDALLRAADAALYEAKLAGRDCTRQVIGLDDSADPSTAERDPRDRYEAA